MIPKERPAAKQPRSMAAAAVAAVAGPSRDGRMDEFFPRHVAGPPARAPPAVPAPRLLDPWASASAPSQPGWARQYARPPKVRRYARLRSRDYSDDDDDDYDDEGCSMEGEGQGYGDEEDRVGLEYEPDHLRWRGDTDTEEEESECTCIGGLVGEPVPHESKPKLNLYPMCSTAAEETM